MSVGDVMKIAVLMSTYNGEKFLQVQMDSLLAQQGVDLTIFVRDDGSQDATVTILQSFVANHHNVRLFTGVNLGVIQSFLTLVELVSEDFDFYALCDQDDYWMPKKLASAVNMLSGKNNNQPLLYCSALEYVDTNLKYIGCSKAKFQPSFGNALVENIVTGCTSVFNRQLRTLIIQQRPHSAVMHDWWMYLLATAFGEVIFDSTSYIKYRQHGGNVVGAMPKFLPLWRRRLGIVVSRETIISCLQVAEFNDYYGDQLDIEKQVLIRRFLHRKENKWSRWLLVTSTGVVKQTILDTIAVRFLILLGWY